MTTREEYIRQVAAYLLCSGRKKREIEKQLNSHIGIGLDEGRQLEEILAEMGEPKALAEEFNDNFEERERKKAKGHRRLIILMSVVLLAVAGTAGFLYWLFPKERDINASRDFDVETVKARAEEVILLFGSEDYEALDGYLSPEVREVFQDMPPAAVRQFIGEDWGDFCSMGNMYLTEVRQQGKSYAIVQVNVSYEKVGVTFTLTFKENMEVYGFYVK